MTAGASIPDRIKADVQSFNTSTVKKERVLSLKLHGNESKDYECWNEFIAKIKEGILFSFYSQISQTDEDVRRLDQQRLLPGWNYSQFFIMKESLGFTFELMNMYDEALILSKSLGSFVRVRMLFKVLMRVLLLQSQSLFFFVCSESHGSDESFSFASCANSNG
jgi:hypothetical protein